MPSKEFLTRLGISVGPPAPSRCICEPIPSPARVSGAPICEACGKGWQCPECLRCRSCRLPGPEFSGPKPQGPPLESPLEVMGTGGMPNHPLHAVGRTGIGGRGNARGEANNVSGLCCANCGAYLSMEAVYQYTEADDPLCESCAEGTQAEMPGMLGRSSNPRVEH